MKEILLLYLENFWLLFTAVALFILIGFAIASLIRLSIPEVFILKQLKEAKFSSIIKAAMLGIPLPLSSSGVIPYISNFKQSGASNSTLQTFSIAAPNMGADSILATYAVFGWFFVTFRIISSVIISLMAGILSFLLIPETARQSSKGPLLLNTFSITTVLEKSDEKSCFIDRFQDCFNDIFATSARSLLIGIVIGAVLITLNTQGLSTILSQHFWLNYILMLLIATPFYISAVASIPLGLSLLAVGFSPGAIFIFLTAGPITQTDTINVIKNSLGKRSLGIYLFSVIGGSLLFALILDFLFAQTMQSVIQQTLEKEQLYFLEQVSAVILLFMAVKYSISGKQQPNSGCNKGCSCG